MADKPRDAFLTSTQGDWYFWVILRTYGTILFRSRYPMSDARAVEQARELVYAPMEEKAWLVSCVNHSEWVKRRYDARNKAAQKSDAQMALI